MSDTEREIVLDPVFLGATRPPMRWGVTYAALILNMVCTMEIFLMSKNLLTLLIAIPIHGLCALLCARVADKTRPSWTCMTEFSHLQPSPE